MKATIERWYYKESMLRVLNWYIQRILPCTDTDSLRISITELEFDLRRTKIDNPFHSGFEEDGFGVYNSASERVLFVECDVDLEL